MPSGYPGYGTEGYGEGPSGYDSASGYGGYGMPGGPQQQQPLVKYKLVRFFDFTAEPGKSYRYRVCVVLEDPNRPLNPQAEPNPRILEQSVVDRLAQVAAEDEEYFKTTRKPRRTYYRKTDWSVPSNIVTLKKRDQFVAGGAVAGRTIQLSQDGPTLQTTESSGKVVTVVWDKKRAAEIPAEKEVFVGSFLDFKMNADALNPMTLQIKTVEEYSFDTDAFVADLRGGDVLIVDKDEETDEETTYYTPGEYLVIDGSGNLIACNEIDDAEEYRRLLFIEDTGETTAAPSFGYPGMEGGSEGMMDYGSGYPGGFPGYGTEY
jgi:hypothetical protein